MKKLLYDHLCERSRRLGRGINVTLLGYGISNRAVLDLVMSIPCVNGVTVRQRGLADCELPNGIGLIASDDAFDSICEDVIIPSPSVRRERLTIPRDAEFISDYDLLFAKNPARLFTVSGSDGKSTTVSLASLLLSPQFPKLFTGGNLGTPLWRADASAEAFLLELSSFTLRYSVPRSTRALLTNVTPNHLDWHADLDEYKNTKLALIKNASEPILNLEDKVSESIARDLSAFCLISDTIPHETIKALYKTEHTVTVEKKGVCLDGEAIVSANRIKRHERYAILNLASAIALSLGYTDKERICEIAESFDGLPERCERIYKDGITYVSSSIDTTPQRTATTLNGLDAEVRIILGGRGKGLSLDPLREPLLRFAKRIGIYGEIGEEMISFIESDGELSSIPHKRFNSMKEAFIYVTEDASVGDTVLLSPAATSYGEFASYSERGKSFKDYISKKHDKI